MLWVPPLSSIETHWVPTPHQMLLSYNAFVALWVPPTLLSSIETHWVLTPHQMSLLQHSPLNVGQLHSVCLIKSIITWFHSLGIFGFIPKSHIGFCMGLSHTWCLDRFLCSIGLWCFQALPFPLSKSIPILFLCHQWHRAIWGQTMHSLHLFGVLSVLYPSYGSRPYQS